jgi:hypothetical protein
MKKVSTPKVVTALEASESPLPAQIQEAPGELVGAAREGLLALSVGVGLGVVHELIELEVTEVVGPKGKRNPDRIAKRHGHEDGSMTLGGRRVGVRRPRMRTADDEHELPVESYGYFADRDTGSALDVGGVDLWTETFGNADHPAILLIGGVLDTTIPASRKPELSLAAMTAATARRIVPGMATAEELLEPEVHQDGSSTCVTTTHPGRPDHGPSSNREGR